MKIQSASSAMSFLGRVTLLIILLVTNTGFYIPGAPSLSKKEKINQLPVITIEDKAGRATPFNSSGVMVASEWVNPHITVTNPNSTIISEVQNWDTWSGHNFILPVDSLSGMYNINLTLDTGQHNGVISASDTFNVTARTCQTGLLCVQVSNNSGSPVADANVEVYTNFTDWPVATAWTDASGWIEFSLDAGSYKLVVSSSSDHFLVTKDITSPGLIIVDPSGTVQVNVNALKLDGSVLRASIIANPSINSHGELGWTDSSGSLIAWVTPGTYAFLALSTDDLYYLAQSGISIFEAANVDLHAALMPTGQMPITLIDFASENVFPWSDQSQRWAPGFSVTSGDVMTFSAMNYNIFNWLIKDQGSGTWYYSLGDKPLSVASGGTYPYTAGGAFIISTVAAGESYNAGDSVSIANMIKDSYNHRIQSISTYISSLSAIAVKDEPLFMRDEAGQATRIHPSGTAAATGWMEVYPHITVTNPSSTIISEVQEYNNWSGHDFVLPGDSVLGTYQVDLSLDTGPHNGVISANDTFTVTDVMPTFGDVPYDYFVALGGVVYHLHDTIQALFNAGYTSGCSTDPLAYCPDNTLTRVEAAVFMLRGLQGTSYAPPTDPSGYVFTDDWSSPTVSWGQPWAEGMWDEGLTAGCSTDPRLFCPATTLTRAEASVFGLRIENGAGYTPPAATHIFADDWSDPTISWAEPWAEAAYLHGLLPACGDSGGKPLFCPGDLVTRAWAAYLVVEAKDLPLTP